MIFQSMTDNELVTKVVIESNSIKGMLIEMLRSKQKVFLRSNVDSIKLAELIENDNSVMEVHTYYYWRSNVLGMFDARYPNRIYVNTKSLPRSIASLVGTNWHEAVHLLDSKEKDYFFHHDGNKYARWKDNTAPYYVGNLASELMANTDYDPSDADKIVTYVPWWRRLFRRIF